MSAPASDTPESPAPGAAPSSGAQAAPEPAAPAAQGGPSPGPAGKPRGPGGKGRPGGKRPFRIDKSVIWILALALVLAAYAYYKSPQLALEGGQTAVRLFLEVLPALLAGFLLGGIVQVLVPKELIAAWAGEGSGWRGLSLATVAGAFTPGGPFVHFPLVASLWKAGAGIGPITAYLISWTLIGINKTLVWEAPVMGWRYTIAKTLACLAAPIAIGWFTAWIYERMGGSMSP